MTRFFNTLLFSALAISFFNSCEQVLEADIYPSENQLVMVSNFTSDNQLQVVVSSTKPLSGDSREFNAVTNAVVRIYQEDNLLEELSLVMPEPGSIAPPTYISLDFTPEVGSSYTLTASAPGYETIKATNIIPKGTNVGDVGFNNVLSLKDTETANVDFSVDLSFQDDPNETNYYHILFYQQLLGYRIDVKSDGSFDTITVQTNERAELDVSLLGDDIPYIEFLGGQSLLMKDESFDGQEVNLTIEGNFNFNIEKHLPGTFSVEIRTVSEAYYLYYTTLVNQSHASSDLPGDHVPVFDNVENGNGIFAGYSSSTTNFSFGE